MKIKRISPRKMERLIAKVRITTPREKLHKAIIRTMHAPECSGRYTLERFAEEMDPKEYIQMRKYYSSIEMDELLKSEIF